MDKGENDKAMKDYNKAIELDPNYQPAIRNRNVLKRRMWIGL